jgi:hypothetical protein
MTAKIAILVDKFHLSMDQIAKLTDRQIMDVYFHKRDAEDGTIVFPEPIQREVKDERTQKVLRAIQALDYFSKAMNKKEYDAAKAKLLVKYGDNPTHVAMINDLCKGKARVKRGKAL